MELDDLRIPEKVRARDPEILRLVVQTYLPQVVRAARGAGLGPDQADDVAQSTFAVFIDRAESFQGDSHVRTWIFGILYRKISEARRSVARDLRQDSIEEVVESRFDSSGGWANPPRAVDDQLYDSEVRERIGGCLEGLPETQKTAFLLREVEGFSTEEICKILEVTRTNVGVLLFRGRNRLRECLESKGVRES